MMRERALKIVLVIVGLLFVATVYGIVELPGERPRRECKDVALLWPVNLTFLSQSTIC